ncbi:MAG: hypothetical protein ACREVO_21000 [Steroidobacteraceae bacterium]
MKPSLLIVSGAVTLLVVFSTLSITRKPTLPAIVQLLGAILLVVVVLTHIAETLRLLSEMGWGRPATPGHYLDLISAIGGVTFLVTGYWLRRFKSPAGS